MTDRDPAVPHPVPPSVATRAAEPRRDPQHTSSLSPDIQRDLYRRLAGVALIYSAAYAAAYGTGVLQTLAERHELPPLHATVNATLAILLGLAVSLLARNRALPLRRFYDMVVAFQVLAAIGIMASAWGWQHDSERFQRLVWEALAVPGTFPQDFVSRLKAAGLRMLFVGGVPWVGVWLLIFPSLLPMSPLRVVAGAVLTAVLVPVILLLSIWVGGAAPSVQPWLPSLIVEFSIPVFICAGITILGSRVVYNLTRDLSRAQQLGSYRLVEPIGMGGMGEVWRAQHGMLVRPAAVKLIRPQLLERAGAGRAQEAVRRFEREAQATAALSSPHTVELYDFGVTGDGTFYYVMELLDGLDLRTLVERFGPMPPERAIHLLRQACHSLEDAHRAGLVHRDIKPANLFACRRGIDYDFVKVLDFGLVKDTVEHAETADATLDGLVRGTPAFMAPEMVEGTIVDGRADLYALGCVGYWLVTGRTVFDGANAMATLVHHVKDEPVPPSAHLETPLPATFEAVVLACLKKNPKDRLQTAAELASRLAACELEVDPWTPSRAEAWWAEHAVAVTACRAADAACAANAPARNALSVAPGISHARVLRVL